MKVVHEQIYSYISESNLLNDLQYSFRKSYSTDSCLLLLTDFIRKESDEGKLCGMTLLDLQKAFGSVDHSLLLTDLKALGFNVSSQKWFTSHLSDRDQRVEVGLSEAVPVTCGVPQRCLLGPLLFI